MTESEVKRELALGWEYAYRHDDWVEPLDATLAGIDAGAAQKRRGGRSIWEIVNHLAVWNENIVDRIETGERSRPAEADWPTVPDGADEAAWEGAKARLAASFEAVRATIEAKSLDALQGGYGLADLLCRFVHAGYHLGQIVKLREAIDAAAER